MTTDAEPPESVLEFSLEVESRDALVLAPWRVLLVDDDPDVHKATVFAVGAHHFAGRAIEFVHAYSAAQARSLVLVESDLALILLDVVMETDNAGLELVDFIRQTAQLLHTRIVLRTGQPGYAPELESILRYDINDYKYKSELTQIKLLTLLTTTLRSYQQLRAIDSNKQALALIANASAGFMRLESQEDFAAAVLARLSELLNVSADGVVLARVGSASGEAKVIAGVGRYAQYLGSRLADLQVPERQQLMDVVSSADVSPLVHHGIALHIGGSESVELWAYLNTEGLVFAVDQELLKVFTVNLQACLRNQSLIAQLEAKAFQDEMLQVPNRARLIAEIDAQQRSQAQGLALCLVDVDEFSAVNELMGHHYGDQLLRALLQRIRSLVGKDVTLARVSGNAFGLLGNKDQVAPELISASFQHPLLIDDRPHRVSLTSGYVELGDEFRPGADHLKNATIALKQAKKSARGQHVVYTADMGAEARSRAQLLSDLHLAFDRGQLFLAYQPQIDLATGELVGLEALMRWRKADGSLVGPDRFIPVAEQSGLIEQMGSWALHTALRDMQVLIQQGLAPLRMAVNVSVEQFKSEDFFETVISALTSAELPGERLELEITESVATLGSANMVYQLSRLRAHGIAVSIDDFGTGYSSLSYLEQLPLDRMKVDKAFVQKMGSDNPPRIAQLIAELGNALGLRVLAEGIESQDSMRLLQQLGCHEGQGFFIGRPMEMAPLQLWIASYRAGQGPNGVRHD